MSPIIKICGLTDARAVQAVIAAGVDYAGFVHFPASPRHIDFAQARELAALLPPAIRSVAVLVDPDDATFEQLHTLFNPACIQLHGNEPLARLQAIRTRYPHWQIIKAIPVRDCQDLLQTQTYTDVADAFLFDAKPPPDSLLPGGNGTSFDWTLLRQQAFQKPWFLSGGLNAVNIANALKQSEAKAVDVSSGVERAQGVKDPALIHSFVQAVRSV